jgi:hypothetical protein
LGAKTRDPICQRFARENDSYWRILLKKSFFGDERNFLGPLMRFVGGDVRDHIVLHKNSHRFDFRFFQQYRRKAVTDFHNCRDPRSERPFGEYLAKSGLRLFGCLFGGQGACCIPYGPGVAVCGIIGPNLQSLGGSSLQHATLRDLNNFP